MKYLFYFISVILFFSCGNKKNEMLSMSLIISNEKVELSIDESVKNNVKTFFIYKTDSIDYYLFQNEETNEILFYEKKTRQLVRKIQFEEEGPNGVGRFIGFYPLSINEFILTHPGICELAIVDNKARVKRRIRYDQNEDGNRLIPCVSATGSIGPIVVIKNNLFLRQMINPFWGENVLENSPVSIMIDTITNEVTTLPLRFPPINTASNIVKRLSPPSDFSAYRCFDGQQFIYSFSFDEYLYVASISHDSITKVKAKSKYIDELKPVNPRISDAKLGLKRMAEVAMYRNILHDPYREVYYRFVYLENELDMNENFTDLLQYGHSLFSILILDKDFNIIGETLFPEFTYNPTLAFVDEDGFYISDSHYKNPDYNEDVLSFQKFDLVKTK